MGFVEVQNTKTEKVKKFPLSLELVYQLFSLDSF